MMRDLSVKGEPKPSAGFFLNSFLQTTEIQHGVPAEEAKAAILKTADQIYHSEKSLETFYEMKEVLQEVMSEAFAEKSLERMRALGKKYPGKKVLVVLVTAACASAFKIPEEIFQKDVRPAEMEDLLELGAFISRNVRSEMRGNIRSDLKSQLEARLEGERAPAQKRRKNLSKLPAPEGYNRTPLPDDKIDRSVEYPEYKPSFFETQGAREHAYSEANPTDWADPADFQKILADIQTGKRPPFYSYDGEIFRDPKTGLPLNRERTGTEGRGIGQYGPNLAVDMILTYTEPDTEEVMMLIGKRADSGKWIAAGGFVDRIVKNGQVVLEYLLGSPETYRNIDAGKPRDGTGLGELFEEMGVRLTPEEIASATILEQGKVWDFRDTDHSETQITAFHVHLSPERAKAINARVVNPKEITEVKWVPIRTLIPEMMHASYGDYLWDIEISARQDLATRMREAKERQKTLYITDFGDGTGPVKVSTVDVDMMSRPSDLSYWLGGKRITDRREILEAVFGKGAESWFEVVASSKWDEKKLDRTARWLANNKKFQSILGDPTKDPWIEAIRILIRHGREDLGARSMRAFSEKVQSFLPPHYQKYVTRVRPGFSGYAATIAALGHAAVQEYLASGEFEKLDRTERGVALVNKIQALGLPLGTDMLEAFYSALPNDVRQRASTPRGKIVTFGAGASYWLRGLRSTAGQEILETVFGEGAAQWFDQVSVAEQNAEKIEKAARWLAENEEFLKVLGDSSKEAWIEAIRILIKNGQTDLGTRSLETFSEKVQNLLPVDYRKNVIRILTGFSGYAAIVSALGHPAIQEYLSSEEFEKLAKSERTAALAEKILDLGLPLETKSMGIFYTALPKDIRQRALKPKGVAIVSGVVKPAAHKQNMATSYWLQGLRSTSRRKILETVFGDGAIHWFATVSISEPDSSKVIASARWLAENEEFLRVLRDPEKDPWIEAIRILVKDGPEDLGTRSYQGFSEKVWEFLPFDYRRNVTRMGFSFSGYAATIAALGHISVQEYLQSEEFEKLAKSERFPALVENILSLELPLGTESVRGLYRSLPRDIRRCMSKADGMDLGSDSIKFSGNHADLEPSYWLGGKWLTERIAILEEAFGSGKIEWLSRSVMYSGSLATQQAAALWLSQNEEFLATLRDPSKDPWIEAIRIMAEEGRSFGTKAMQLFALDVKRSLPKGLREFFPKSSISFSAYFDLIAALGHGVIQTYLSSSEFLGLPFRDRLKALIRKIRALGLPMRNSAYLGILTALPRDIRVRISGGMTAAVVSEAAATVERRVAGGVGSLIRRIDGKRLTDRAEILKNVFGEGAEAWFASAGSSRNGNALRESVNWLLQNQKFLGLLEGLERDSAIDPWIETVRIMVEHRKNPGTKAMIFFSEQLKRALAARFPGRNFRKIFPILRLSFKNYGNEIASLGHATAQDFLSSKEFEELDKYERTVALFKELRQKNLWLETNNLRFFIDALPEEVRERVAQINLPMERFEQLQRVIQDERIQVFFNGVLMAAEGRPARMALLIEEMRRLGLFGEPISADTLYGVLPRELRQRVDSEIVPHNAGSLITAEGDGRQHRLQNNVSDANVDGAYIFSDVRSRIRGMKRAEDIAEQLGRLTARGGKIFDDERQKKLMARRPDLYERLSFLRDLLQLKDRTEQWLVSPRQAVWAAKIVVPGKAGDILDTVRWLLLEETIDGQPLFNAKDIRFYLLKKQGQLRFNQEIFKALWAHFSEKGLSPRALMSYVIYKDEALEALEEWKEWPFEKWLHETRQWRFVMLNRTTVDVEQVIALAEILFPEKAEDFENYVRSSVSEDELLLKEAKASGEGVSDGMLKRLMVSFSLEIRKQALSLVYGALAAELEKEVQRGNGDRYELMHEYIEKYNWMRSSAGIENLKMCLRLVSKHYESFLRLKERPEDVKAILNSLRNSKRAGKTSEEALAILARRGYALEDILNAKRFAKGSLSLDTPFRDRERSNFGFYNVLEEQRLDPLEQMLDEESKFTTEENHWYVSDEPSEGNDYRRRNKHRSEMRLNLVDSGTSQPAANAPALVEPVRLRQKPDASVRSDSRRAEMRSAVLEEPTLGERLFGVEDQKYYEEAKEMLARRMKGERMPDGFWKDEQRVRHAIWAALDTIDGFREARKNGDIKRMAELYRKNVIHYRPGRENAGGQQDFFHDKGRLNGLMASRSPYLDKEKSPPALVRFALPGLIDRENPDAIQPHEADGKYWDDPENGRYHILKTLNKIDGFKEARETNNIKRMVELYRKNVIGYRSTKENGDNGQVAFFREEGGLATLMAHKRLYLDKRDSPAALLRFAVPGMIDLTNPDALDPLEVENFYWTDPENAKYHILKALDTIPEFKRAREANHIKGMTELYREKVMKYPGGQTAFFCQVGGLMGLMNSSPRPYFSKHNSAAELVKLAVPELVDPKNPEALRLSEISDEARSEEEVKGLNRTLDELGFEKASRTLAFASHLTEQEIRDAVATLKGLGITDNYALAKVLRGVRHKTSVPKLVELHERIMREQGNVYPKRFIQALLVECAFRDDAEAFLKEILSFDFRKVRIELDQMPANMTQQKFEAKYGEMGRWILRYFGGNYRSLNAIIRGYAKELLLADVLTFPENILPTPSNVFREVNRNILRENLDVAVHKLGSKEQQAVDMFLDEASEEEITAAIPGISLDHVFSRLRKILSSSEDVGEASSGWRVVSAPRPAPTKRSEIRSEEEEALIARGADLRAVADDKSAVFWHLRRIREDFRERRWDRCYREILCMLQIIAANIREDPNYLSAREALEIYLKVGHPGRAERDVLKRVLNIMLEQGSKQALVRQNIKPLVRQLETIFEKKQASAAKKANREPSITVNEEITKEDAEALRGILRSGPLLEDVFQNIFRRPDIQRQDIEDLGIAYFAEGGFKTVYRVRAQLRSSTFSFDFLIKLSKTGVTVSDSGHVYDLDYAKKQMEVIEEIRKVDLSLHLTLGGVYEYVEPDGQKRIIYTEGIFAETASEPPAEIMGRITVAAFLRVWKASNKQVYVTDPKYPNVVIQKRHGVYKATIIDLDNIDFGETFSPFMVASSFFDFGFGSSDVALGVMDALGNSEAEHFIEDAWVLLNITGDKRGKELKEFFEIVKDESKYALPETYRIAAEGAFSVNVNGRSVPVSAGASLLELLQDCFTHPDDTVIIYNGKKISIEDAETKENVLDSIILSKDDEIELKDLYREERDHPQDEETGRSEMRQAPARVKIAPDTFMDVKTLRVPGTPKVKEKERREAIRLMPRLLDGYFRIRGNLWPSKTEEERTEMLSLHLNDPLQIRFVNLDRYGVRFPEIRIIIDSEESLSYVYHIPSEKKWIKGGLEDRIANLIGLLYGDEVERLRFGNLASHVVGSSYWEKWRALNSEADPAYRDYHERIHPLMTKVVEAAVRHAVPIHGEIGILDLLGGDGHFLLEVMGNLEAKGLKGVQAALIDKDAGSVKTATKLLSKHRNVKVYPATDIRAIKDFDAMLGKKYPIVTAVGGFNEQVLTLKEAKRLMKKVYDYLPPDGLLIMTGRSRPLLDADYLRDQVGFEILNTYVPSLNVPLYILKKTSRVVSKGGEKTQRRSEMRETQTKDIRPETAAKAPNTDLTSVVSSLPSAVAKEQVTVKPWQILKLEQDVVMVVEQSKIDALSPEMFRELLELVGVNNTKLHLVIPDAIQGKYSDRVAELKSVGLVYYGSFGPALPAAIPVVGFSDMEKDTLEAFQKRLDSRLAGSMKDSVFGMNQRGAFGVGILYALRDILPDALSLNPNGFRYDASGRFCDQVLEVLKAYTVIARSA